MGQHSDPVLRGHAPGPGRSVDWLVFGEEVEDAAADLLGVLQGESVPGVRGDLDGHVAEVLSGPVGDLVGVIEARVGSEEDQRRDGDAGELVVGEAFGCWEFLSELSECEEDEFKLVPSSTLGSPPPWRPTARYLPEGSFSIETEQSAHTSHGESIEIVSHML